MRPRPAHHPGPPFESAKPLIVEALKAGPLTTGALARIVSAKDPTSERVIKALVGVLIGEGRVRLTWIPDARGVHFAAYALIDPPDDGAPPDDAA